MNITFTDTAIKKLEQLLEDKGAVYLKLKYDTDNCGCEGIPVLWIIGEKDENDHTIDTNFLPIQLEQWSMYFWDERMIIHYDEIYHSFQLKSSGQMINPRMKARIMV